MPYDDATLIEASRLALYDRGQLLAAAALLESGTVPRALGDRVEFLGGRTIVFPSDAFGVAQATQNALIESAAMRARCLYEFFFRPAHAQYIRASDYFDGGVGAWVTHRNANPIAHVAVFAGVWARSSALAAHVGPQRVDLVRANDRTWDWQPIASVAEELWQRFVASAPPLRLHTDATASRRP